MRNPILGCNILLKPCINYIVLKQKRNAQKWAGSTKGSNFNKITNITRALEYYDFAYQNVYGDDWKIIRGSLLEEPKYSALINNFAEYETLVKRIENAGAFDIGKFYSKRVLLHESKLKEKNDSSTTEEEAGAVIQRPKPSKMRPSLIELTEDEKAALADQKPIDRYPEIYRQQALAAGILSGTFEENKPDASRKLDTTLTGNVNISSMYSFIPSVKLKGLEEWIEESDVFRDATESEHEIGVARTKPKEALKWPEQLKAYSFVLGDTESEFPAPHECKTIGLLPHYLFNGSSLLPVLALDVKLGDKVLDLCASPGGKSMAILQTYLPGLLVCNDVSKSRLNRLVKVLEEYVPEKLNIRHIVEISNYNGCLPYYEDYFDKVLVDVPCLNDRHSVHESDNSIFKPSRVKERMRMPELQAQLLFNAIRSVKPGGSVVYSTCTLSPLQNDGSVHLALTRIWRETKMECTVVDLGATVRHLGFLFKFGHNLGLRYGHIVIPVPGRNFGPMYFCKIIRNR